MSTESLDETHHTEVAPSHAQMIEQLLHDAPHRPAPEGVRIVALWWIEHLRETRESHADAYLALRGLRSTLRENRELLSDAPLKRGMRHLQELDGALDAVCTAAAERAWLESEADMLLPDAAAEAQELSDVLEEEHQQLERRAATALRKHFDAFDQIAQSALPHFTVHGTVGVSLNLDAFSAHLSGRLDRSLTRIKRAMQGVQDASSKREIKRIAEGFVRVRAILQPFVTKLPSVGTLYHSVSHGQQQLEAMRIAARLAKRARRQKLGGLAAMLDDVSLSHYSAFASEWLADKGERCLASAYAARAALQLSMDVTQLSNASITSEFGVPMEIERKFLLSGCPPEAAVVPGTRIEQGWIPGRTLRERLRRSTYPTGVARYTRTVKFGRGISRVELEEDTDRALFDALWPLTVTARVRKRRHAIRDGAFTWEIDVFSDRDLVLAEVELRSADENPCVPTWLERWVVREVTHEAEFINANLAMADEDPTEPAGDS